MTIQDTMGASSARFAKAGDKFAMKARRALANAMGKAPIENVPSGVSPKTDGDAGQWFCITCGSLPKNNLEASGHQRSKPTHPLAWRSFVSGKIEAP